MTTTQMLKELAHDYLRARADQNAECATAIADIMARLINETRKAGVR